MRVRYFFRSTATPAKVGVRKQCTPPPRKPWMSEDRRMGLFDAAALALVFFQSFDKRA